MVDRRRQRRTEFPKVATYLDDARDDFLAFVCFPKPHRTRRTDGAGIFANEAAIIRLVGALMLQQNDEWRLQRRYMQLEDETVSKTSPLGISAVVTR